jgi:hypothetical protein
MHYTEIIVHGKGEEMSLLFSIVKGKMSIMFFSLLYNFKHERYSLTRSGWPTDGLVRKILNSK